MIFYHLFWFVLACLCVLLLPFVDAGESDSRLGCIFMLSIVGTVLAGAGIIFTLFGLSIQ